jgi:hypothetical protein
MGIGTIRPEVLPRVTSLTAGDTVLIDGASTRSILAADLISGTVQHFTGAGAVTMAATDTVVAVDKAVGAASAVSVPLSSDKIGGCLVSDFKGDAGTNNITITLTSPDKFPGGGSTWVIASDAGSVFLRPIPGVGYTL